MRRYFDPKKYRVVLLDQRGCGRSAPRGSVDHNTTWDLVSDIERIRDLLGIDRWVVFGGSWGAALALNYAQKHPDRVVHLVLRGLFLMTSTELAWFYGGGGAKFWPDRWAEFIDPIWWRSTTSAFSTETPCRKCASPNVGSIGKQAFRFESPVGRRRLKPLRPRVRQAGVPLLREQRVS